MDNYVLLDKIGKGGFATVYRCQHLHSHTHYACKVINKHLPGNNRIKVHNEINVINRLISKGVINIPRLHESFEDSNNFYLIQDLCQGGSLNMSSFDESHTRLIIHNLLQALKHIHQSGFIHKDIKHDNILFSHRDSHPDSLKICDFGLAMECDSFDDLRVMNKIRGTPWFLAPECSYFLVGPKSDVWSVGVITYMMLSGSYPFCHNNTITNINQLWTSIRNDEPSFTEEIWQNISKEAIDFIKYCFIKPPTSRPSSHDCLTHSWFLLHR